MLLKDLPDELLQHIIEGLEFKDIYNLQLVSNRFYSLIKKRKLLKIPCTKLWFTYEQQIPDKRECGVWISKNSADLLNLDKQYYSREYTDNFNIKEVMKYWLSRFEFEGSCDLGFPVFDDELFELFYKHRRQFRKCSRFAFYTVDLQLSQDNLKRFLRMSERVDMVGAGDCISNWKLMSLKVLNGLNIPEIEVASDEDNSYMNDEFLEKIVFPSKMFVQRMEMKTTFTLKKLVDYLEIATLTDQSWKFGIFTLGDISWEDALQRIQEIGKTKKYVVDSWPTDDDMHRIFIHDGQSNLHVSFKV